MGALICWLQLISSPDFGVTYLMTVGTQVMLASLDVNGEATDASASEREMPACAVFSAPQSFAPSPHIPTKYLKL